VHRIHPCANYACPPSNPLHLRRLRGNQLCWFVSLPPARSFEM